MGVQPRGRRQGQINFVASSKQQLVLSRGNYYRELMLTLASTITISTGAQNTAAAVQRGDFWGVIQKIEVVCNGTEVIRSISGVELWWFNAFNYRTYPQSSPGTLGDGSTATAITYTGTLILPFWMPLAARPVDTMLDSSRLSELRLDITWGTAANVSTAATAVLSNTSLQVDSLECFGLKNPRFAGFRFFKQNFQPAGATAEFDAILGVGDLYRGFIINVTTTAGTTDQNNTGAAGINNIKLISGQNTFRDYDEPTLRMWQRLRSSYTRAWTGSAYANPFRGTTTNVEDAWYFLDLCNDGYLTEGLDTAGYSELKLQFSVLAACQINIIPLVVQPVRSIRRRAA